MANLQTPQIIEVKDNIIRIKHPDISANLSTSLGADSAAAAVALTVLDNEGWLDNDYFLVESPGNATATIEQVTTVGSRGASFGTVGAMTFAHSIDAPITKLKERQIRIMGATTLTGSQTQVVAATNITFSNAEYTEYFNTSTAYAYYFAEFYDGTNYSTQSDGIGAKTSATYKNKVVQIIDRALKRRSVKVGGNINYDLLLEDFNDAQDIITETKDWDFELASIKSDVLVEHQMRYTPPTDLKYQESDRSLISLSIGNLDPIDYKDWNEFLKEQISGTADSTINGAVSASATSITLDNAANFADAGTIYVVGQSAGITYTSITGNVLTVAADQVTATLADGSEVWQGVSESIPTVYTIYNEHLYLYPLPSSDYAGQSIDYKYYKALTRAEDINDVTEVTSTSLIIDYLEAIIEKYKENDSLSMRLMQNFDIRLKGLKRRNDDKQKIKWGVKTR